MIRFIDVTDAAFNTVFDKMTTAFPYEERRDCFDQKECLKNSYFNFFEISVPISCNCKHIIKINPDN